MPKQRLVTICRGLPASGKSTWAKAVVSKSQGSIKRINKDELREMLDGGKYSKTNEVFVLKIRDRILSEAMDEGKNVIVDDTNLHPKHGDRIREIVSEHNKCQDTTYKYAVIIRDFTDISPEECIRRDNKRANGVGHSVIMSMYEQFLKNPETPVQQPQYDPSLRSCIICDLDGTLADNRWRDPFDATQCYADPLIESTARIIRRFADTGTVVIYFSGRPEHTRQSSMQFLEKHLLPTTGGLFMRAERDSRKDAVVKRELYEKHIKGKFNVLFVLDDRNQVVDMWRKELGLPCHQVNYGDF